MKAFYIVLSGFMSLQAMELESYVKKEFAKYRLTSAKMIENSAEKVIWKGTFEPQGTILITREDAIDKPVKYKGFINNVPMETPSCKYWLERLIFKANNP